MGKITSNISPYAADTNAAAVSSTMEPSKVFTIDPESNFATIPDQQVDVIDAILARKLGITSILTPTEA